MQKRTIRQRVPRLRRLGVVLTLSLVALVATSAVAVAVTSQHSDVAETNPFAKDIAWLAQTGITKGCAPNEFCPKQYVTREQMAAFMHRMATSGVVDAATVQGKSLAEIPGATGPAGADGARSLTGPAGDIGPVGPEGPPGTDGATGAAGVIGSAGAIGPTGPTGADSVVAGPQGLTGPRGADSVVAGPQGLTGPRGADSVVAGPQGLIGPPGAPRVLSVKEHPGSNPYEVASGTVRTVVLTCKTGYTVIGAGIYLHWNAQLLVGSYVGGGWRNRCG